ncbi:MAG: inorganic phosphate transporter [Leadbetterella sp.]
MELLDNSTLVLFVIAILAAVFFEFINGFHDTANAVATVIYTNSLKPTYAVVWSGIWNFIGVITGGVGVGMSIVALINDKMLLDPNVYHALSMVLAILIAAIVWNFGTWYFGIPSSSSHTLIGSILGVGLGYAFVPENATGEAAVNMDKVKEIFTGLFMAPLLGFALSIVLMFIIRRSVSKKVRNQIFAEPEKDQVPPTWIRGVLIGTCTLVSFFHGKNDGQKGIGLVMLILISVLPAKYAIDNLNNLSKIKPDLEKIQAIARRIPQQGLGEKELNHISSIEKNTSMLIPLIANKDSLAKQSKLELRAAVVKISSSSKKLLEAEGVSMNEVDRKDLKSLATKEEKGIRLATDFAPPWVILMISIALGLGTMIGWKRIVVTVGEKIGKTHLSYAQGASAELVAAVTIGLASGIAGYKLPVSTTHTLSSGVAGAMVASKGVKNLQGGTIRNIALAWVLTLPVSMLLSAGLFLLFRFILG